MTLGYFAPDGVWIHGESDTYATFSERLNKGQESVRTALATAATAKVAKVSRSTTLAMTTAMAAVPFDAAPIALPGAWAVGAPTRLVLPRLGLWRVTGTAAGTGMDTNLLRGAIALSGVEVPDSREEANGVSGKCDPFVRPSTVVLADALTDYVELLVSTESNGELVRAGATLTAEWIGS